MATYNQVTPEIIEELKKISGDRVVVGADVNPDYSRDEMPIYGTKMPDVSIDVLSTEEVSAIMKVCYDNNIPVTCRGAGTGLVGACTPIAGGVVLCTMRMKQILEYDTDNFVVRVQPGVLLNDLAEDALKQGLLYPPDPGEKFATLGGNVSTNAGGMRAVKYGATRDYVRAMTVVLPTGEIVKMGATVSKIADFVLYIKEIDKEFDFEVKMFGHAGDGNLHVYTCSVDMEMDAFVKQVDQFMRKLYAKTTELGGQISGEHGIGMGKVEYLAESVGPVNMRLMEEIKKVFDPKMILNPGKVCYTL